MHPAVPAVILMLGHLRGDPTAPAPFLLTVPKNFPQELRNYTVQGFRVIALAHKTLNVEKLSNVDRLAR